jgi:CRP/FNR family transcriptional regulator, cyclic AMP receptor protein
VKELNDRPIDFRIFREVNSFEETYQAGAEIVTPGDTSRTMYILKKGVVAVQIHNITVEQIEEGGIFGEMGIVDPRPHTARVVALTDVTLCSLNEQQFLKLIGATPTFALRVMRVLARRVRAMNSKLPEMIA